jgi:hypothetical protein
VALEQRYQKKVGTECCQVVVGGKHCPVIGCVGQCYIPVEVTAVVADHVHPQEGHYQQYAVRDLPYFVCNL